MYASATDLETRIGDVFAELYRRLDGTAMSNEASEDLAAASAEIDGAVGMRYSVPVSAAQALPLLKSWCLTLAEELAWARSGRQTPESVKDRVKTVRDLLAKVAAGSFSLAGASLQASDNGVVAEIECDEPVFGRKRMRGY
jgi:phage gp36-like protein